FVVPTTIVLPLCLLSLPPVSPVLSFFFNDPSTTDIYTLSLHDALPISPLSGPRFPAIGSAAWRRRSSRSPRPGRRPPTTRHIWRDRKSTRLNSSHQIISYAVFCLKKKTKK